MNKKIKIIINKYNLLALLTLLSCLKLHAGLLDDCLTISEKNKPNAEKSLAKDIRKCTIDALADSCRWAAMQYRLCGNTKQELFYLDYACSELKSCDACSTIIELISPANDIKLQKQYATIARKCNKKNKH